MSTRAWMVDAACAGTTDPELFFPTSTVDVRPAIAVCSGCPVAADCYAYSLRIGADVGVWGGVEHGRKGPRSARHQQTATRHEQRLIERERAQLRYERKYAKSIAREEARRERQRAR